MAKPGRPKKTATTTKSTKTAAASTPQVKKAETEAKAVVEKVEKKVEEIHKETAKTAAEVKEKAEKITTEVKEKAPKSTTLKKITEIYIQYAGKEVKTDDLVEKAKEAFAAAGNKKTAAKDVRIYVKPEEDKAYFVINNDFSGDFDL